MKRIYAEQVNDLLQGYHFNIEFMGNTPALAFTVLQNGLQHLYGGAFCSGDTETAEALRPILMQVIEGGIPQPLNMEACECL